MLAHRGERKDRARHRNALLVAGLILVVAVLPAEYGVDPLGIGRRLGLLAIGEVQKKVAAFEASRAADAGGVPTIAPQEHAYQHETVEFKNRVARLG